MISVGFLQGLSLGFLTIPINIITFATLPSELRIEAAGIYSLMRNLGSAIGISVTGALLEMNTQVNHAIIAGGMSPFNRAVQGSRSWNFGSTQGTTLLDQEITRQAQIIAYIDDFKLMLVIAVIVLPLLLLTKPSPRAPNPLALARPPNADGIRPTGWLVRTCLTRFTEDLPLSPLRRPRYTRPMAGARSWIRIAVNVAFDGGLAALSVPVARWLADPAAPAWQPLWTIPLGAACLLIGRSAVPPFAAILALRRHRRRHDSRRQRRGRSGPVRRRHRADHRRARQPRLSLPSTP